MLGSENYVLYCTFFYSITLKVYSAVVVSLPLFMVVDLDSVHRHAGNLTTSTWAAFVVFKWQDKIPDTEVLDRAGQLSVQTLLPKSQERWAGHVVRMSDDRLPNELLYRELQEGKRTVGGQKTRHKDTLK